ncbi:MAG TPA: OB-fold nucleic acid binding domain-containing protein [Bryobacteraceae bacterium]|nr:OB-fold nucleic acid binding domain-containing protein [Bryobacteraceae bacterium]
MKSPYIAELAPNQPAQGVFLVQSKDVRQKKTGEPYLSLILADRTGELEAKMWDNAQEVLGAFEKDDFIRIKGVLQIFQNRPQLTIHKLQPVAESEADITDFLAASRRDRDEMFAELRQWIASTIDPHLKGLLERIFADEAVALAFRTAPAAKSVHHNFIGGLIEHVLSLCHLAKFTAAHYADIDFDLLLAGVILHDIGKTTELTYARSLGYSTVGQLIGHISIGMRMVEDAIRQDPDFPPAVRDLLLHMILSHHGALEFGSPKVPVFLEALLLNQLDTLDAKMECMRASVEKDRQIDGVWTGYVSPLERSVLKKRKYLEPPETPAPVPEAPRVASNSSAPAVTPSHAAPRAKDSPFAAKLQEALQPKK